MTLIHSHDYDSSYNPAMPVITIQVARRIGETPFTLTAIVDSGADATQIPLPILHQLQARQGLTGWLSGSAGGRYRVNLYKGALQIAAYRFIYADVVGTRQDEIIVGRDILNQFVVTLNAPGYVVTIAE